MAAPGLTVRLSGMEPTVRFVDQLRRSMRVVTRRPVRIGTPRPYAYGIETGRHRSGRLARRAGGARMLSRAALLVQRILPAALAAAWLSGPRAMDQAWSQVARRGQTEAQRLTPVGRRPNQRRLRDSYVVEAR